MNNKPRQFPKARTLVLGAATLTLLWAPGLTSAQSTATQDRSTATQDKQVAPGDDITRRDLAHFDQFLDSHRDIAEQLRRTPSLIDDPQYLQRRPELNTYLQDHPSVKQEISARPDTFMRLEDLYDHDTAQRDRDAGGQDRDAFRRDAMQDRDVDRRGAMNQDRDHDAVRTDAKDMDARDQDRDVGRKDAGNRAAENFDRFLDQHREIGEQARKNPSLLDDRKFVESHAALQTYFRDNPEVRDQLRQDPNAFMRQVDLDNRDASLRDRDRVSDTDRQYPVARRQDAANQDRDAFRTDARDRDRDDARRDTGDRDRVSFDRFLDQHREIGEQVRRNPSLLDDRKFVESHPALETYFRDNPGVRDDLRQDPNAFMRQARLDNDDRDARDRDARYNHMADFRGFLGNHADIQKDLSRDPSVVKDRQYVQSHGELNAYLDAHPDVRDELMANPQNFIHGAQQPDNHIATGNAGPGGTSTGTSMNPGATTHVPKPNQ